MSALLAAALLLTGELIGPRRDQVGGPDAGTGNAQREVINGTSAHVFGTITSRHSDVVTTTSVKYDLVHKDHHWVVYDITTRRRKLA